VISRRSRHDGWPYGQPPSAFTLNHASPQAKGLVGWWPTAGTPGASVLHNYSSRKQLVGTFPGGAANPAWATERALGVVISYSGAQDVTVASFNISAVTVSMWVKTSQVADMHLLNRDISAAHRVWQFRIQDSGGRKLQFVCFNTTGGLNTATGTTILTDGVLHHVVGTYGSEMISVYVDGLYEGQAGRTGTLSQQVAEMRIGKPGGFGGGYYTGLVGDIRVYNRALSPAEIWQLWAPQTRWDLYRPLLDSVVAKAPTVGTGSRTLATTGAGAS